MQIQLMTHSFFRIGIFFSLAACVASCGQGSGSSSTGDEGLATLNKDSLAAHIQVLSSDSFQGRRPFTAGEDRTVDYLTRSFTALGLEPGNGSGYTQDVPMVEISPVGTPAMKIQSPKSTLDLKNINDFVIWTERPDSAIGINMNEVVF